MVPFRKGADGEVAREWRFEMRFETFACERQLLLMAAPFLEAARYRACASRRACAGSARGLRRFGGFATSYGCRSHPSSRGGECATLNNSRIRSQAHRPPL